MRFDPVGGGQFQAAIKTIIEAESQPIKQLEARKKVEDQKLKLFQEFKGKFGGLEKAIDEVSTFKKFRELKVDLGDGASQASVTLDKEKAQVGSWEVRIDELAARTSVMSNGFEDPDSPSLGIGFIVMENLDGDEMEIFVDEKRSSLRGVASLINQQANCPIRASVIKDSSEDPPVYKLIMTAKKDGKAQEIHFPDFYFLDGEEDFYIDDTKQAQNAHVFLDGFEFELESNTVQDFLPGMNLTLKQAKPDQAFTMTVTEDFTKISGKIKNVVDQINGVLQFINKQNQVDQSTDTKSTFAGDTGLQTIEFRIRNLMHEGFPVPVPDSDEFRIVFMSDIGIEFDKTGNLTFKEDKFTKFMEKDFEGLSAAISGEMGFAFQAKEMFKSFTSPIQGTLALRESGLRNRIKDIDAQIERKQRALEQRQANLVAQFSRLSASISNMQKQQQYLSASLPSAGGGNIVSQLLG